VQRGSYQLGILDVCPPPVPPCVVHLGAIEESLWLGLGLTVLGLGLQCGGVVVNSAWVMSILLIEAGGKLLILPKGWLAPQMRFK